MNRQSLQALIIDRQFGELSPEDSKLLETLLETDSAAREEADRIRATLETAREVVIMHPELARIRESVIGRLPEPLEESWSWLARAAAILALAALSGFGGFLAGRVTPPVSLSTVVQPVSQPKTGTPVENSPWTQYRIASNPAGAGLQIVRLENHQPNNTIIK